MWLFLKSYCTFATNSFSGATESQIDAFASAFDRKMNFYHSKHAPNDLGLHVCKQVPNLNLASAITYLYLKTVGKRTDCWDIGDISVYWRVLKIWVAPVSCCSVSWKWCRSLWSLRRKNQLDIVLRAISILSLDSATEWGSLKSEWSAPSTTANNIWATCLWM